MSGIDSIFGVHEKALLLRERRAEILANNLANSDTPNYKAKDLDFASALRRSDSLQMLKTNPEHLAADDTADGGGLVKYRIPNQPSIDGNTVDANVEKTEFAENAVRYQATLTFLSGRIRTLMTALRGE